MDAIAHTNTADTTHSPRTKRPRPAAKKEETARTPESELMTVEEYFGMVWNRVNEYYARMQNAMN